MWVEGVGIRVCSIQVVYSIYRAAAPSRRIGKGIAVQPAAHQGASAKTSKTTKTGDIGGRRNHLVAPLRPTPPPKIEMMDAGKSLRSLAATPQFVLSLRP